MQQGGTIATRSFSLRDQQMFAELSGDHNPIHLDEVASRRTMAGAPVIHGVHGVLWALNELANIVPAFRDLSALKVQFPKFVFLDQDLSLRIARRTDSELKAELATDGGLTTILNLKFGATGPGNCEGTSVRRDVADLDGPRNVTLSKMQGLEGALTARTLDDVRRQFPSLCASLGEARVMSLALLSALVGMECPGMHSIFAGFDVRFLAEETAVPFLAWNAVRVDERFRRIAIHVRGAGFEGEVQAFARPEPVATPLMADLCSLVAADEFAGRTALVIGGTRGLGAITAKLLAAGGAKVFATYASGKREAEELASDAVAAGKAVSALHLDITKTVPEDVLNGLSEVTHVYYFATPRIGQEKGKIFVRERLETFLLFYVDGFQKIMTSLRGTEGSKLQFAFYPSTVFLDDRPKGMTEYAMAKAAGEVLAKDLAEALGVRIIAPRLPKLLTDQTVGLTPVEMENPIEVLLPVLRAETASSAKVINS